MIHLYIKLEGDLRHTILYEKGNNLEGKDNLSDLPAEPAVYAICGRVNGQPANPRFVGEADNLQEAVKNHFSTAEAVTEDLKCVNDFIHSIKTKVLVYQIATGITEDARRRIKERFIEMYEPRCNEEMNTVY